MIPAASEVLGLPPGAPSPVADVAALRYLLIGLVAVWCWSFATGRRRTGFAVGLLSACLCTGFWILTLERPWGVLVDPEATRVAAELSVASESGGGESFVVGEAAGLPIRRGLLALGLPLSLAQLLPTLLPLLVLPALGLAVCGLWENREVAALAGSLVLIASTGELGASQGWGLLPGIWSHPAGAAMIPPVVALVLLAARAPRGAGALGLAGMAVYWLAVPAGPSPSWTDAARVLTLDQGLWLPLALLGLRQRWDPATRALVLGGASLTLLATLGAPAEAWGGLAIYRVGLVLAGARLLWQHAPELGAALHRFPALERAVPDARGLGAALVLIVAAPGSQLVWWDPPGTDPVAESSLAPPSPALDPSLSWIRENTPRDAVFLASPAYAPVVAVRAGRRVLRAPEVASADAARRVRAERLLLVRRPLPEWVRGYGVGWVFAAPGDYLARGIEAPESLVGRPGLRLRYRDPERIHILEVVADP
jgi:hypothetical protein